MLRQKMNLLRLLVVGCLVLGLGAMVDTAEATADDLPYVQHKNIVYAEVHGVALVMDIFVPKGELNGYGLVDAISGAFYSGRSKIRQHKNAQFFKTLCARGYVVFAVRPGSISKFTAPEMLANLRRGFAWVNEHAKEYGVTQAEMGMTGASAGGYLASMTGVKRSDFDETKNLKSVGVFFPPTDFLQYGPFKIDIRTEGPLSKELRALFFPLNYAEASPEEVEKTLTAYSPARIVTEESAPFLLIHGNADLIVPLQQSVVLQKALEAKNVPVELVVKEGGGHPWPTIHEEVVLVADFFDRTLRGLKTKK